MKKIILLSFVGILLSSCSKNIDVKYSCDDEVQNFVATNKESLAKLSYGELIIYREDIQRAVFRAMTVNDRMRIWRSKFILLEKLSWTSDEAHFITLVSESLSVNMFDEAFLSNSTNRAELTNTFKEWIKYCENNLKWNNGIIYSVLGTLEIHLNEKNEILESYITDSNSGIKASEEGTCKCSTSSDWCNFGGGDIGQCGKSIPCVKSSLGCGTLWTYTCDGICELGPQN